jgi:hypothetical protein
MPGIDQIPGYRKGTAITFNNILHSPDEIGISAQSDEHSGRRGVFDRPMSVGANHLKNSAVKLWCLNQVQLLNL